MPSPRLMGLPSHAELAAFIQTFLPPQANVKDVHFVFRAARHPLYQPERRRIRRVVFGVTPSAGFYSALNDPDAAYSPACFLHRPWTLNIRAIPRDSLVLASHNAFDANLTVGWNQALAARLNLVLDDAICIKGYKSNPDREIGLVARLKEAVLLDSAADGIKAEFGGAGELYAASTPHQQGEGASISIMAIMNAFHIEEIERVLSAARSVDWIAEHEDGRRVLYLTGAARDYGLEAAAKVGMPAYCVGHRACEEWGIRYLAQQTRLKWPALDVVDIVGEEPEETETK